MTTTTGTTGLRTARRIHAPVGDDGAAFEHWYRAEHPRLLAAMTVVCGDRDVAADVTAEAFARALAAWRRVGEMESPGGWTYRVAVNLVRRRGRRRTTEERALRRIGDAPPVPPPDIAVDLWAAVRTLPPRERLAIALRYVSGLSEQEVAEAMGVTVGTASSALSSARRKLAAVLTEEPDDA